MGEGRIPGLERGVSGADPCNGMCPWKIGPLATKIGGGFDGDRNMDGGGDIKTP